MMKNGLCLLLALFLFGEIFSQAPQALNYQAVARDNNGDLLANQNLGIRLSILDGSPTGSSVYTETHSVTTNQFGLFTLLVGTGTVSSGSFSGINWAAASKFLKVEMDPNGGTAFAVMGTSQLVSVPYALFADSSRNPGPAGPAGPAGPQGPQGPPGPLVSGTSGQTLRHDGISWAASSLLFNNGTNIGIGTTTPADRLEVNGTLRTQGFRMPTGGGNGLVLTSNATGVGTWQPLPQGGGSLDDAYDFGGAGAGRQVSVDAGPVELNMGTPNGTGMDINVTGTNAIGFRVDNSGTGVGVRAENTNASNAFSPVQSSTNSASNVVAAVVGNTTGGAHGVAGQATAGSSAQQAVYGSNLRTNGGHGVRGVGFNGVVGETNYSLGYAVYGENFDQVFVSGALGVGVAGRGYYGVFGEDRYNGQVSGAYGVYSNGNFAATGGKSFRIDHPLDPENKFLIHYSIESPEVLNQYRGNAIMDANGEAVVDLPDYFSAINRNFSYHLTPVGAYAPVFIKEKINGNQFVIGGGNREWRFPGILSQNGMTFFSKNDHNSGKPSRKNPFGKRGNTISPGITECLRNGGFFTENVRKARASLS